MSRVALGHQFPTGVTKFRLSVTNQPVLPSFRIVGGGVSGPGSGFIKEVDIELVHGKGDTPIWAG